MSYEERGPGLLEYGFILVVVAIVVVVVLTLLSPQLGELLGRLL